MREGWLDVVMPMIYAMSNSELRRKAERMRKMGGDNDSVPPVIDVRERSHRTEQTRPASRVKEQIQLLRAMGIHGYRLFWYNYLNDDTVTMLQKTANTEPAVPFYENR